MLERLLGFGRKDIVFVCSSPIDEVWIRSTAIGCHAQGLQVLVAMCGSRADCRDDVLEAYSVAGVGVRCGISLGKAARIRSRLVVTASSGLDRKIFPTRARLFIHMPHSLVSLHMIYPADAFDGYDVLFAAGPQHEAEFAAIASARGLTERRAFATGYGKLDVLARKQSLRQARSAERPLVLLAPSWGKDNLLDRCGVALASALVGAGFDVVVRPHPLFFLDKSPVIAELTGLHCRLPNVRLESPYDGDEAIFDADVLVGDYSGIGFEFAALRRRPVVSVDVGLKVVNPGWKSLNLQPVEIASRNLLGPIVSPDVGAIVEAVTHCITGKHEASDKDLSSFLYGMPGSCSGRAVEQLQQLLIAS